MLAPYIEGHAGALRHLGLASLALYDNFIARVATDAGRRIEYRRTGTLQVARHDADVQQLEQDRAVLIELGAVHSYLDGDAVRRLEPALAEDVCAGIVIPSHGYVGVTSLVTALGEAARAAGATLSATEVHGVARVAGVLQLETADGTVTSDAVVLAAGSWSGGILVHSAPSAPVHPVRGQLLQLRFDRPPLTHVVWGAGGYLVPWEDGRLLVGATVEDVGFDEGVTTDGVQQLLERAQTLLPSAQSATCDGARAGLRPATPDELPIIGASATVAGLYYATGHYRNGVLLAPLTAGVIADLVLGRGGRDEFALVRPDRFGL